MKMSRYLFVAVLLAVLAPAGAQAQEVVRVFSRGMLGILTESVPANDEQARRRVVTDVIEGSAAHKAGILEGDTIVRINGKEATGQVMATRFQPGDKVVLRIRRGGRERDVTVVASERSRHTMVLPDSINRLISRNLHLMRETLDTMTLPRIEVRRRAGDSTMTMLFGRDTITMMRFHGDSAFEVHTDGNIVRINPERMAGLGVMIADSVLRTLGDLGERMITFGDTTHFVRPGEVFRNINVIGGRSIAGAELAPLNPALAEYFGTSEGVLVMNAREGTPAERAGLRGGDVIYRVNGTNVKSIGELRRAIDGAGDGGVQLRVLRRGQNVDVRLRRD